MERIQPGGGQFVGVIVVGCGCVLVLVVSGFWSV